MSIFTINSLTINKNKTYAFYIFYILFVLSCKKENAFDCFKSSGSDISETRILGNFNSIELKNKVDVNITNGNDFKIEVVAGKHIIKNISTKVVNGVLVIENENTCNFVRGYKRIVTVNVTLPKLEGIVKNNGVGTIRFEQNYIQDTLVVRTESSGDIYVNGKYNQIRTSAHGNGDIYLNGLCNSLYVYTFGTNYLKAENLIIKDYAFVETLSLGDCYLNVDNIQKFDYNIHRSGNIYYTGNPITINDFSSKDGTGQAIKQQ